jgi:hypothetical protein
VGADVLIQLGSRHVDKTRKVYVMITIESDSMITDGLCALMLTSSAMSFADLSGFRRDVDFAVANIERNSPSALQPRG